MSVFCKLNPPDAENRHETGLSLLSFRGYYVIMSAQKKRKEDLPMRLFATTAKTLLLCFVISLAVCGCSDRNQEVVEVSEEFQYVITTSLDNTTPETTKAADDTQPVAEVQSSDYVQVSASSFFWMEREEGAEIVRYAGDSTKIEIPRELLGTVVTSIGSYCFSESAVAGIRLPDSIRTLADNAFAGAAELQTVYIPSSVVSFGENLFDESASVTIIVEENSPAINYFAALEIPVTLEP